MPNDSPLVSIGLPVYNGEDFIAEALESLLCQSYSNIEILISDNGSSDSTEEICKGFIVQDSRVRYVKHPENKGAAFNYNYVVHNTSGKYFKWASHDDLIGPKFIEKCVINLEKDDSVALAASETTIIDEKGRTVKILSQELAANGEGPAERLLEYFNYYRHDIEANQVFGVYRRTMLIQSYLIANYPSSDLMLLGQIAMLGKISLIPEPIFCRRDHINTSLRANTSSTEVAQWFDPNKSKIKKPLPIYSRLWDFLTFTLKSPMPLSEKFSCFLLIIKWAWNAKHFFKLQAKDYIFD